MRFATPPPYGATPPLGGSKSVRLASPPPYGAIPPLSGTTTVNRKSGSQPPPNGVVIPHGTQALEGLQPPILEQTGGLLTGAKMDKLRIQNRRRCHALQQQQVPTTMWSTHTGQASLLPKQERPLKYRNEMCPAGSRTRQENYCQSGHNWDAQQKQANRGQKRRCGKQWLEGRINRPDLLKHLRISQRKAPRKQGWGKQSWSYGTISRTIPLPN